MPASQALIVLSAFLLASAAIAAPVTNAADKDSAEPNVSHVEGQDQDLEDLLSVVNKQAHRDDVMVHKEHVTHIENNNGQSVKVEEKEEKVVDTDTGAVLADVQQRTEETGGPDGSRGTTDGQADDQTVVETKVDIPDQGVHRTFLEQDGQDTQGEATDADGESADVADNDAAAAELSPTDIAAYLYATQQFEAFYSAMDKLVNESKMSAEDADAYTKSVAMEYERLQLRDLEQTYALERRPYPQPTENDLYRLAPGYDLYPQPMGVADGSEPTFDMLAYVNSLMTPEEQEYANQGQNEADLLSGEGVDPYQFVASLWREAYGNGNQEAQDVVRMLYDRVSQDSNPDDVGEIRDILLDTVAQSLEDTPYSYVRSMDTPRALSHVPAHLSINQEGAGPQTSMGGSKTQVPVTEESGEGEAEQDEGEVEAELSAMAQQKAEQTKEKVEKEMEKEIEKEVEKEVEKEGNEEAEEAEAQDADEQKQ